MPDAVLGSVIDGRYRVLSRLGAGGMADVYLAEDEQLSRKIALKLLYRRFAEDPGFVERFRREAQAAAGLQHPNVVGVYDRGSYDGTYYIAMEYVPGRTLKRLIRDEAPLDPVRAIDITLQMLKAARFAHKRGVIHRDLKPHNVIIDDQDQAKVTDFGIARAGASDMTETGSILGTAQYLSPEQAQGHAVSASSDLYSIAVVLYEMLTGNVPFDAEQAVTIAIKHVSEAPTAVTQINPTVPAELEQVVMWALNKNPADRPADADQFIAALEHAKAAITSGQAGQRTAAFAAVGAGGAVAGGLVPPTAPDASAVAGTSTPAPPIQEADGGGPLAPGGPEPPREHPGRSRWLWAALVALLLLGGGGAAAYFLTRPKQVAVTPVVGEQLDIARTQLQNAGFKVAPQFERNPHPYGYVFHESPNGGTKADKNSTVSLTVSNGPGNVQVPPVQGETVAQAQSALRTVHLKPGVIAHQASGSVADGSVISSSPAAGTSVAPGSSVNLTVSSGNPKVKVPGVVGQNENDAKATLTNAGFTVTTSQQQSSTVQAGKVISQSPSAGSQVASGSTVSLVIAKAAPKNNTASVPDVKGQSQTAATSSLQSAGFLVGTKFKTVTDSTKNGIVLTERPSASSKAKKGSTVTITVGQYKAPANTTTNPATTTPTTTTGP